MSGPAPDPQVASAEAWDAHVHVFDGRPVPGGHYQPGEHTLARLQARAAGTGLGRFVLVQPSVYGSDNRLLLEALRGSAPRHRGVVVLQGDESDAALDAMAEAGVRGVRINAVSPQGNSALALAALAPRLRARGWFVQWYVQPAQLAQVAALTARFGLLTVLDHLAGLGPGAWAAVAAGDAGHPATSASFHPTDAGLRDALARLADQGAWIKLSGWYRLAAAPPYSSLLPVIAALHRQFDGRCVWGSDWPHTHFMAPAAVHPVPAYASLLAPLHAALGEAAAAAVLHTAPSALLR